MTTTPVPFDANGVLKTPNEIFFNNSITASEVPLMEEAWEFGDGSPENKHGDVQVNIRLLNLF